MMKKAVVSQRSHKFEFTGEIRDTLDERLSLFLMAGGFYSFPIPSTLYSQSDADTWLDIIHPDLIVLSGGQTPGEDLIRDKFEERVLDFAKRRNLPVYGICRGMQFLGYREGEQFEKIDFHVATKHKVFGTINKEVNSYHNYGFKSIPKNYNALAYSDDGVVEAMMHKTLPWFGTMWHPERNENFDYGDVKFLQNIKNM